MATRHRFRPPYAGAVTCLKCIDHRDAPTHDSDVVHWIGEAFEWAWGLGIIAAVAYPLIHALVQP